MSKEVRWQMRFASCESPQKLYKLDIYDEQDGSWSGITTLLGGSTPFKTEENNSDDFFSDMRCHTGTINICTDIPPQELYPTGGKLKLEDLLPDNNLSRPVRLTNLNTDTIEWQGFLSCEAYSQQYTSIPQSISFSVISVLEAMDSVEVELSEEHAFQTIIGHIAYAMKAIEDKSGMTLFRNLHISSYCQTAFTTIKYYNNVYFNAEEQINIDNITVEVHSISCKQILQQVAAFFGGCWREFGQDIALQLVGLRWLYYYQSFANIKDTYLNGGPTHNWTSSEHAGTNMADLTWRGTDHQISVAQGARRVVVRAALKDFECNMSLEETPYGNLVENPESRQSVNGEVLVNTNETFYNLAEHQHILAKAVFPLNLSGAHLDFVQFLSGINYANTIFWTTNDFRSHYYTLVNDQTQGSDSGIYHYMTSFMCWWRDLEGNLQSGLMICGVPKRLYWSYGPVQERIWNKFALTADNYLFKQRTPLIFAASDGFLKVNIETLAWSNAPGTMPSTVYANVYPTLTLAISIGNMYAHYDPNTTLYTWSTEFATIDFPLEHKTTNALLKTWSNWNENLGIDQSDGRFFPIPHFMAGFVTVRVYHEVDALCQDPYTNGMFDALITKLDVEYVPPKMEDRTDRSENVYSDEIGKLYKDEIEQTVNLATDAKNRKLATMLWSDGTTPMKLITLGSNQVRPESDLLGRMKKYYSKARNKIDLKVAHPTAAPLPFWRLNGIGDGKTYSPMAEGRDWQQGVSTLTCIENPEDTAQ